ncbi:hypothetical protein [Nitratireductor soli]|uniref:hypothetical protein n=1 Tax=Nitratireductor soli TaxID=1670619 RepID=UPI00065DE671|nr:hypothetical protein [Nitratireductor soli]
MKEGVLALIIALAVATPTAGQSMTPMRGEVTSFTDEFAVRIYSRNPYNHRVKVAVRVYDSDFKPIEARVSPSEMLLGGNASRPVLVVVGFEGERERRVRICTESVPFPNQEVRVKGQVCGKFIARRR